MPNDKTEHLKRRTKQFGLRAIRLVQASPKDKAADVIGRQLLRSATSVGANYRSALRARSAAEFISRLAVVEEEIDESHYWLEMIAESGLLNKKRLAPLMDEADEITCIVVAAIKTTRSRQKRPRSGP